MDDYRWEEETENFKNAYITWIFREMRADGYWILFDILYDVEFKWDEHRVPMDSNREADGRYLRRRFSDETAFEEPAGCVEWPASFLEVVVALAFRVDDQLMFDPESPDGPWTWFWDWMANIGLDRFTDEKLSQEGMLGYMRVIGCIDPVLERTYDSSGNGGLFPLKNPGCDQRLEEMWFQANSYMGEKFIA